MQTTIVTAKRGVLLPSGNGTPLPNYTFILRIICNLICELAVHRLRLAQLYPDRKPCAEL